MAPAPATWKEKKIKGVFGETLGHSKTSDCAFLGRNILVGVGFICQQAGHLGRMQSVWGD